MTVFWAWLMERYVSDYAVESALTIAERAGAKGYKRITLPYMRTDVARTNIVAAFRRASKADDDVLVMLDCDHRHPVDVIDRLVAHRVSVVGALAFRRGAPYFPCVFFEDDKGEYHPPLTWRSELQPCDVVGTGAIAIQRKVFDVLEAAGLSEPFFRYEYPNGKVPSEDIYFAAACAKAGIQQYCDFTLITPHLTAAEIDDESWRQWVADHPQDFGQEMAVSDVVKVVT